MLPRLPKLAVIINASGLGLVARIEPGFCNTDRKAGRLRIPGKGRTGNRLIVTDAKGAVVLDHNAAETYRKNDDVVSWMRRAGIEV